MSSASDKKGPQSEELSGDAGVERGAATSSKARSNAADPRADADRTGPIDLAENHTEIRTVHLQTVEFRENPAFGEPTDTDELADIYATARALLAGLDRSKEHFVVLTCGVHGHPYGHKIIASGTRAEMTIKPAVIFRNALLLGARTIVVMHNRVSGDATPSEDDLELTRDLAQAGSVINIPLLDHLIVALPDQFRSMRMEFPQLWHDVSYQPV